ncbi:hypothetical protein FEK33_17500 [Nocardia asteroides NBRC 15531]|uniref:hypothetical protein n=1 Tax=Nocardia asteroides TaxID=1824 RepID=UPI00037DCE4D|nr:hypothetical protein [Nocardia asteroides]TLF67702.1 hypothetical protein FEK33_17500 [Nocardia asteroides NBRC 15531]UGT50733.1 hypothetical protein LT345_09405 [Nocardia asteroides]SFN81310.1 hypothetical protein SAMN05444423_1158 [Nocardia asteroides]VEG36428.1 Uncharacterised protein [Nocardia asteroides]
MTSSSLQRPHGPRTPRWVKVVGVVVALTVALLVVGLLVSGGQHGPGRHGQSAAVSTSEELVR